MNRSKSGVVAAQTVTQEPGQEQEVMMAETAEEKLLSLLDPDPLRAEERYNRIFQKLNRFFTGGFCRDPENLAGETILRTCRALSEGLQLTCAVETYLFGVANNVAMEDYRRRQKAEIPLEDLPWSQEPRVEPETGADWPEWRQELTSECLQMCLKSLDEEQRSHLETFYRGDREGDMKRNRKLLASQLGTNPRALSSRMLRLRTRLEVCIKACLRQGAK